jgi:multidrug efflux pump subunit AcrA (membrane-fusion protein)
VILSPTRRDQAAEIDQLRQRCAELERERDEARVRLAQVTVEEKLQALKRENDALDKAEARLAQAREALSKIANYRLGDHHPRETTSVGFIRMMNIAERALATDTGGEQP